MGAPSGTSWQPQLAEVVAVLDARGMWLRKVVVGEGGHDFPCWEVAWENEQDWVPWPVEDVRPVAEHPDALTREEYRITVLGNYTEPAQRATPNSGSGESSGGVSE